MRVHQERQHADKDPSPCFGDPTAGIDIREPVTQHPLQMHLTQGNVPEVRAALRHADEQRLQPLEVIGRRHPSEGPRRQTLSNASASITMSSAYRIAPAALLA